MCPEQELLTGSQQKTRSSSAYYRHVVSPYIVLSDYCADLSQKLPQYPQILPNCLSYLLISHNLHFILSWLSFSDVLITNLTFVLLGDKYGVTAAFFSKPPATSLDENPVLFCHHAERGRNVGEMIQKVAFFGLHNKH